jgi:eukaryotic-like serine/threonine-protein kinase
MAIQSGTHLGTYEILAPLGAGGMGEVYRARDGKLGRDVALKVLPEAFARDAERMSRFQREAKVLASLNHPNIATIHGLEDSAGAHALVMELVEGLTLADRIKQGPIPTDEALKIAKQICEALEYAHERGIVHRDLKPANVKVTNDDAVKVLDFGLAKAIEGDPSSIDISSSPTMSRMATMQGVLLGTAAYMSPEQAKAKSVDRRADIWAFGCVVYEMLTGKRAFDGETVTDTLAAVIKEEPDWSQLPAATSARVRVLLRRCLQKDSKQRLRDIGEARIAIDEVLSGSPDTVSAAAPEPSSATGAAPAPPLWRRVLPWAIAALVFIALAPIALVHFREKPPAAPEPTRFQIPLPDKTTLSSTAEFSMSPDGRQLAFGAVGTDGTERIWVRSLDSLEARPLSGSESDFLPPLIWSPDSQYIAFQAGGKLKKIAISGGPAQTLCDFSAVAVGGSWNRDGVIIFGDSVGGVMRISANGGVASPLTVLDPSRKESRHLHPLFLPDGRHFIYLRVSGGSAHSGVYVGSLDAKPEEQSSKQLLATDFGAAYVPSADPNVGELLFLRDGTLFAQPFDARRLELIGDPVIVAEQIGAFSNDGHFSASTTGVLVYRVASIGQGAQLTWLDRAGKVLGASGEPGNYQYVELSPDGTRAAVTKVTPEASNAALWLVDLQRGTNMRFTFGPSIALRGIWSPDGNRVLFASYSNGVPDLYQKPASGAEDEQLVLKSDEGKYPTSWSRDGRFLLYYSQDAKTRKVGLWVLPLEGDKKPFPFLATESDNYDGKFSPDGHWVAYTSDESGRAEIYVRTFSPDARAAGSDTGGKWLISTEGGSESRWRGDGKELCYLAPNGNLMAVEISTAPTFRAGVPKVLFHMPPGSTVSSSWDVTADGKRFLFPATQAQSAQQSPFTVVLNWQAGLKK